MLVGFDEFEFDSRRGELMYRGTAVHVETMVLRLLSTLVERSGKLVTKEELMNSVWEGREVSDNVLSVTVSRLRKVLGHRHGEREFVENVSGRGYRFVCPVRAVEPNVTAKLGSNPSSLKQLPFVGRDSLIARLRHALAKAADGRGGLCLLTGEAGVGKTALAEHLASAAEAEGVPVAWGFCHEVGAPPALWPFTQLLRAQLRNMRQREISLLPSPRPRKPASQSSVELVHAVDDQGSKHARFEAILSVLESAHSLLILDDLHHGDAASLELLRYWMDRLSRSRVLVIATVIARPCPTTCVDLAAIVSHSNCMRVALSPLERASVERYVSSVVPAASAPLLRAVWTKSEGNPLFMLDLVQQIKDATCRHAARLRLSEEVSQRITPQIMSLETSLRTVLSLASVLGRTFELKLLHQVSGQELETLIRLMDLATAIGILAAVRDSSATYAFGHEVTCQLLYNRMDRGARRQFHLQVGKALAHRASDGEIVPLPLLAHHFHAALPLGDPAATLDYCLAAALEATAAPSYLASARHLQHALDALSVCDKPSPTTRLSLMFQRAVAARIAGLEGFERMVEDAAEVARAMRSGRHLIDLGTLMYLIPGFTTYANACRMLEEGLRILDDDQNDLRAAGRARLATCGPISFDTESSAQEMERAIRLVSDTSDASFHRFCVHLDAQHLLGSNIALIPPELGPSPSLMMRIAPVMHDIHVAILAHQAGLLDAAHAARARVIRYCGDLGFRELGWHAERFQLLSRLQHVAVDVVAPELRALHLRALEESITASEVVRLFDAAVVLKQRIEADDLHIVLAHSPHDSPAMWSVKVQTLAAAGCLEEAANLIRRISPSALENLPRDRDYLGTLGALSRAALVLGRRDYIETLYGLLHPYEHRMALHISFLCLGPVAQLLGELAVALDWRSDALAHFVIAGEIAARLRLTKHAEFSERAIADIASAAESLPPLQKPTNPQRLTAAYERGVAIYESSRASSATRTSDQTH